MTIAAHIDPSLKESPFLQECILRLAGQHLNHEFIVFVDKIIPALSKHKNCLQVIANTPLKSSLLLHYWYSYKLPGMLNKYGVTIFLGEYSVCSLRTTVPQIMVVNRNFFTQNYFSFQKNLRNRYLKKYFPVFAKKAAIVCAIKPSIASELAGRYAVLKNKIPVFKHGIAARYKPIELTDKNIIQEKYTAGNAFFVSNLTENISNMIAILKAFSIFKKRLKSSIQLILINKLKNNTIKDFHLYKYRNEVQIINCDTAEMEAGIIASAYAGICVTAGEQEDNWVLQCMTCAVPLIAVQSANKYLQYEDAAIYATLDEKEIGEKMMLLYKDENYRNAQIKKGTLLAASYDWERSSGKLWQTILQTIKD